ncbi:hypothetical protein HDU93_000075 [Gonapodya sp. JEL0774]|nr:hypothetical protein HDU93_000075 [Gonapodya sp. JEL0774]
MTQTEHITIRPLASTRTSGSLVHATFSPVGCTLTELIIIDRDGVERDVALGFETPEMHRAAMDAPGWGYLGSTAGRVANRIADAKFSLDGCKYVLTASQPPNTLHGGGPDHAYDAQLFSVKSSSQNSITFSLRDFHDTGSGGFPGTLDVEIVIEADEKEVRWTYLANLVDEQTEKKIAIERGRNPSEPIAQSTPVAIANHAYLNLSGMVDETVVAGVQGWPGVTGSTARGHVVCFPSHVVNGVLEFDPTNIPTGKVDSLVGPMDFGNPRELSASNIPGDASNPDVRPGWDNYFTVDPKLCSNVWQRDSHNLSDFQINHIATISSPTTGISLSILTTEPGFQFYTSSWLDGMLPTKYKPTQRTGRNSSNDNNTYGRYSGLAIEPHPYVNAVNHPEWKAQSVITRGGKGYSSKVVWNFSVVAL